MILKHSDNLSSTLQHKSMSAAGGQEIARMTIKTLKSFHEDQSFDLLHHANEPHLPRQRKRPRRFEEGTSQGFYHKTPKNYTDSIILKPLIYLLIVFRSDLTSLDTKCMLDLNLYSLKHAKMRTLKKN